jgi:hypothetical protein
MDQTTLALFVNSPNLPYILLFLCVLFTILCGALVIWFIHTAPKQLSPGSAVDQNTSSTTTYKKGRKLSETKAITAPTEQHMEVKGFMRRSNPSQFGEGKKEMKFQGGMEDSSPVQGKSQSNDVSQD